MEKRVNEMIPSAYAKHPMVLSFKAWLACRDTTATLHRLSRPGGENAALWLAPNEPWDDALLLFHGMGNDHLYGHLDLFTTLLGSGVAILSVDLDGHGVLSTSRLDAGSLLELAPKAWSILEREAKGKRLHLAGYSLGAALSLEATRFLTPHTLTLVNLPMARPAKWRFLASEAASLIHPSFLAAARRHGLRTLWPAFGRHGRLRYPVRLEKAAQEWAYVEESERFLGRLDLTARATALSLPALWIRGTRDQLCPKTSLEALARRSKKSSVLAISGAGHLTTLFHEDLGAAMFRHMRQEP